VAPPSTSGRVTPVRHVSVCWFGKLVATLDPWEDIHPQGCDTGFLNIKFVACTPAPANGGDSAFLGFPKYPVSPPFTVPFFYVVRVRGGAKGVGPAISRCPIVPRLFQRLGRIRSSSLRHSSFVHHSSLVHSSLLSPYPTMPKSCSQCR
jgi:hypothetical protein